MKNLIKYYVCSKLHSHLQNMGDSWPGLLACLSLGQTIKPSNKQLLVCQHCLVVIVKFMISIWFAWSLGVGEVHKLELVTENVPI